MTTTIQQISIVTTCFNADKYIEETVRSVLNQYAIQSGRVRLQYIIRDGGSGDDTVARIEQFQHPAIQLVSEPDRGFHDGLVRGLRGVTGDVIAYLNAGDYYHPAAFDVVLDVLENHPVDWLTGLNVAYNDRSQVTGVRLPYRYRRPFIRHGLYDNRHLPFIQQESTFWTSRLHQLLDFDRLSGFSYAGDAFLWHTFAGETDLFIVESCLGGFRSNPGQISLDKRPYRKEMKAVSNTPGPLMRLSARLERLAWLAPDWCKRMMNRRTLIRCDPDTQEWRIGMGARSRRRPVADSS